MELGFSVSDVLRQLDEDSDSDFDGYIEEDDMDRDNGSDDSGNDNRNEEMKSGLSRES